MTEQSNANIPEADGLPPVGPKTALVSIVGRPSAGKSTFLNTASGEEISIVSAVPQTTRNAIRGIVNTSLGQLVFVDTPGLHKSDKKLNLRLTRTACDQVKDSDAILYIIDTTRDHEEEEKLIASLVAPYAQKTVIALNKRDSAQSSLKKAEAFLAEFFPDFDRKRVVEMSARNDTGVDDVLKALYDLAPEGPQLYPEEFYTDQEVDFRISEIVRGEAMNRLDEELPHALYVRIEDMEMASEKKLKVRASLCVERESQKGIVIGKGAAMIKQIRLASVKKCAEIFPYKVELDLQVKVDKNWRQKDAVLNKILR